MDQADREELARRSIDAWNAGDWEKQLAAIWSRDGLIVSPEGWPESGEFRGWPAMLEQWRRIKESWAEERVELIRLESVGERVLTHLRWTMRGEASGAPLEVNVWGLYALGDDRIVELVYFLEAEAARAAAEEAG